MKIAYVYDAVYPWEPGGVQKRVWELARRLATDHDVHWYGLHYWDGPSVFERDGVTLHGVADPPELYIDGRRSIPEAIMFATKLLPVLRYEQFDVVDCQEFPYFPCFTTKLHSILQDTTLAVTWHEVWDDYWYDYLGRKGKLGQIIELITTKLPDIHIAVSHRTQLDVARFGVSKKDLYQLPNGVSLPEVAAVPEADRDVDILFVGRFIKEKNADLVVKTVNRLQAHQPDLRCIMVGEGPERETVETLTAEYGLSDYIQFTGHLEDYDDVLGLMKAADVFLFPSQREGFGITALEALACGTPVVTIDHPQNAVCELVNDENGAVCMPTPKSLAEGVKRVTEQVSPQHCLTHAEAYDWDQVAVQAELIYQEVA